MVRDTWRDTEGFGRPVEVEPRVWSQIGPDDEDHGINCEFIWHKGILPCTCDATRKPFGKDVNGDRTYWYQKWLRWAAVRAYHSRTSPLVKWPVEGPDGDWWVPGVDFNDF